MSAKEGPGEVPLSFGNHVRIIGTPSELSWTIGMEGKIVGIAAESDEVAYVVDVEELSRVYGFTRSQLRRLDDEA